MELVFLKSSRSIIAPDLFRECGAGADTGADCPGQLPGLRTHCLYRRVRGHARQGVPGRGRGGNRRRARGLLYVPEDGSEARALSATFRIRSVTIIRRRRRRHSCLPCAGCARQMRG